MIRKPTYYFKTKAGTFYIKPRHDGGCGLWIDSVLLANYHKPEDAADDVAIRESGYHHWDEDDFLETPPDSLDDWLELKPDKRG